MKLDQETIAEMARFLRVKHDLLKDVDPEHVEIPGLELAATDLQIFADWPKETLESVWEYE